MPPYQVEADSSYRDDWQRLVNDDKLSPLFRDHDSKIAPPSSSCRLDKRQSDPEYAAAAESGRERALSWEDPNLGHRPSTTTTTTTTTLSVVSMPVSRITAIIGPESAYIKFPDDVGGLPPPKLAADGCDETKRVAIPGRRLPEERSPSDNGGGKVAQSLLVRASRLVGKRGWKLVKYIPIKLTSAFGTVGVGEHQNVI
ncbi:hypothetical protein ACHAXA_008198 [Cyclostephanos tholiformis]|jgi:hypothetical protein|uniref:Uncharacterized protein n=1 Tax=Cyclostephanos tholiformis TaxID=382380 RepID=A0ABD3SCD1_9STRA